MRCVNRLSSSKHVVASASWFAIRPMIRFGTTMPSLSSFPSFGVSVQNMAPACSCPAHSGGNLAGNQPPLPLRIANPQTAHGSTAVASCVLLVHKSSLTPERSLPPPVPGNAHLLSRLTPWSQSGPWPGDIQSSGRPDLVSIFVGGRKTSRFCCGLFSRLPRHICTSAAARPALGRVSRDWGRDIQVCSLERSMVWPGPELAERAPEAAVTVLVPR